MDLSGKVLLRRVADITKDPSGSVGGACLFEVNLWSRRFSLSRRARWLIARAPPENSQIHA